MFFSIYHIKLFLLAIVLMTVICIHQAQAHMETEAQGQAEPLVINTFNRTPISTRDGQGPVDLVVREAFKRIDQDITIVWRPLKRGLDLTREGQEDGHYQRVANALDHPDLITVPFPIFKANYIALSRAPEIRINHWSDLDHYSVGYPRGWRVFEVRKALLGHRASAARPELLLAMLERNRIDVILGEEFTLPYVTTLKQKQAFHRAGSLLSENNYLVLHKKHADLVPKLSRALEAMFDDGTTERLCSFCAESLKQPRLSLEN